MHGNLHIAPGQQFGFVFRKIEARVQAGMDERDVEAFQEIVDIKCPIRRKFEFTGPGGVELKAIEVEEGYPLGHAGKPVLKGHFGRQGGEQKAAQLPQGQTRQVILFAGEIRTFIKFGHELHFPI